MTGPPPPHRARFSVTAAVVVTLVGLLAYGCAWGEWPSDGPRRGHSAWGLALGVVASAGLLTAALYSLRKRAAQERLPGRLQTWLRVHAWVSGLALWIALVHSGFHLDGAAGTWSFVLFAATVASGVGGYVVYAKVPGRVSDGVGNLAVRATQARLATLRTEIEDLVAGRSPTLQARVAALLGVAAGPTSTVGTLAPDEEPLLAQAKALDAERRAQEARLDAQRRWHRVLRGWLWVHVPLSLLLLAAVAYHGYDATDARWLLQRPTPDDYASPETCAECHPAQFEEWLQSPHAVAQSSPLMDLQNRLVVLKERADLAAGRLSEPVVRDLCVKCHAPTAYLPGAAFHEDVLAPIHERAPAGRYGISCVTCHQLNAIHRGDPARDPDGLAFKNAENLEWSPPGHTMFGLDGTVGRGSLGPSVGNRAHRAQARAFLGESETCASCHTVTVDLPKTGARVVKLQDTYSEWKEAGVGATCMDCHSVDLAPVADLARFLERERVPLAERVDPLYRKLLSPSELRGDDGLAAWPRNHFDRPLFSRRRFRHTFTGVDTPLEDGIPFLPGHPRHADNARIRDAAIVRTADLLRIAAGVRIVAWPADGVLKVDVGNLATGHHMPAGFAFAREAWLEVSVAAAGSDAWRVVVGGREGREVVGGEPLDKADARLRNFQAVLFDGTTGRETVLQNETTAVLTGPDAVAKGFVDRERFLKPGEVRTLTVPLATAGAPWDPSGVGRIRVRLRFRHLPPELLESLAVRFDALSEPQNAARARALAPRLPIHRMAEDAIDAPR